MSSYTISTASSASDQHGPDIIECINACLDSITSSSRQFKSINKSDLEFLQHYLNDTQSQKLLQIADRLNASGRQSASGVDESEQLFALVTQIRSHLKKERNSAERKSISEVRHILDRPQIKGVMQAMQQVHREQLDKREAAAAQSPPDLSVPLITEDESESHRGGERRREEAKSAPPQQQQLMHAGESINEKRRPKTWQQPPQQPLPPSAPTQHPRKSSQSSTMTQPKIVLNQIRNVQISRPPGAKTSLGFTVTTSQVVFQGQQLQRCVVERILAGSYVHQLDVLRVGDVILELNGSVVDTSQSLLHRISEALRDQGDFRMRVVLQKQRNDADHSMTATAANGDHVTGLNSASNKQLNGRGDLNAQTFVRAFFSYEPHLDKDLPRGNVGLAFEVGDVLKVVNKDDVNFWQAYHWANVRGEAGLIPSSYLQEKRQTLIDMEKKSSSGSLSLKRSKNASKKWKEGFFKSQQDLGRFDRADLWTYEEVVEFAPSRVATLLIVGADGIGKKAVCQLLCKKEPHRFADPIIDTTDHSVGRNNPIFRYVRRAEMEQDIKEGRYFDWQEVQQPQSSANHCMGIRFAALQEVIGQGKTAVIDCSAKLILRLRTADFNPQVVFLSTPDVAQLHHLQQKGLAHRVITHERSQQELSQIAQESEEIFSAYRHLFSTSLSHRDVNETAAAISRFVREQFETRSSWIPASWQLDLTPLPPVSPGQFAAASPDEEELERGGERRHHARQHHAGNEREHDFMMMDELEERQREKERDRDGRRGEEEAARHHQQQRSLAREHSAEGGEFPSFGRRYEKRREKKQSSASSQQQQQHQHQEEQRQRQHYNEEENDDNQYQQQQHPFSRNSSSLSSSSRSHPHTHANAHQAPPQVAASERNNPPVVANRSSRPSLKQPPTPDDVAPPSPGPPGAQFAAPLPAPLPAPAAPPPKKIPPPVAAKPKFKMTANTPNAPPPLAPPTSTSQPLPPQTANYNRPGRRGAEEEAEISDTSSEEDY